VATRAVPAPARSEISIRIFPLGWPGNFRHTLSVTEVTFVSPLFPPTMR
jgi:hypothetical protein